METKLECQNKPPDRTLRSTRYHEVHAPYVTPTRRQRFREAALTIPRQHPTITPTYARRMLKALRKIAAVWRGKCVSTGFNEYSQPVQFVCSEGHHFELDARCVRQGMWCLECAYKRYLALHLGEMRKLAARHGGVCLSDDYSGLSKPLQWRCDQGHEWTARPNYVTLGYWCRECARLKRAAAPSKPPPPKTWSKTISQMQEIAAANGGECLSAEYVGMHAQLDWQCRAGHRWSATALNVSRGRWCPACTGRAGRNPVNHIEEPDSNRRVSEPVPVLTLHTLPVYTNGYTPGHTSGWAPGGLRTRELDFGVVSFDYDGVILDAYDSVTWYRNARGEVVRINRDAEAERSRSGDVSRYGLVKVPIDRESGPLPLPSAIRELKDPDDWPDFISRALPALRRKGWRVIIAETFRFNVIEVDAIGGTLQQTCDGCSTAISNKPRSVLEV
jgi:hypothetical protein